MSTPSDKFTSRAMIVEIDESHDDQRIDNFLVTHLKGVPKSHIYRILRKGEVRVNKGRIRPNYRLKCGDQVRIPPVRQSDEKTAQEPHAGVLERIASSIIYEDTHVLALNKPAGIAVHGGSGVNYGVIEAMRVLRPDARFLELVHRLDRETSGCLLIAKKRSALRYLHELLRDVGMAKHYRALVCGQWQGTEKRVDLALQKNTLRSGERVVRVDGTGKSALTIFRPLQTYALASLVDVELKTGRTHQIRVHAAASGFPIAGDEKYGDSAFNRAMREQGLKRLFLHAYSLEFTSMDNEQIIRIEAPLPRELATVLDKLSS